MSARPEFGDVVDVAENLNAGPLFPSLDLGCWNGCGVGGIRFSSDSQADRFAPLIENIVRTNQRPKPLVVEKTTHIRNGDRFIRLRKRTQVLGVNT